MKNHHHHHQSVLSKGRTSTANSGIKVAVLLGINRCDNFLLLSHPTLSLASEQTLKDPRGPTVLVNSDLLNVEIIIDFI